MAEKKSIYDELASPDYMGDVDSIYKEVNNEAERQEKQARLNTHAAILGDMARVWADSSAVAAGGWGVKEREPMANKANERLEKIKQGKAAMKGQYAKDRAAARQQQLAWDLKVAQGKAQEERDRMELAIKIAEQNRKDAVQQLDIALKRGEIDEQEYKIKKARIEAEFAPAIQRSVINRNNGANAKEFMAYDAEGGEHWFKNADAAEAYARQQGTWEDITTTDTVNEEGKNGRDTMNKTTTTTKVTSGRSVKPKKGAMPGVGNSKKMPGV